MGYTVYWKVLQSLTGEQVRAALRFLSLEHDRSVVRLAWVEDGVGVGVCLDPVVDLPVDSFVFFCNGNFLGLGYCKTNRIRGYDREVKRLLVGVSRLVGGCLRVWDDDGVEYA